MGESLISSRRNPRVQAAAALHRRRDRAARMATLLEGPHLLAEAFAVGFPVTTVFALADDGVSAELAHTLGAELVTVTDSVLSKLAPTEHPRGPIAEIAVPVSPPLERVDTVVLWGIADPGNAGTLLRTAAAFGFQVAATPGTVDLWSPKVLRAAAGAQLRRVPAQLSDPVTDLARIGLDIVASVVEGGDVPQLVLDRAGPIAIVIGNEAHGAPAAALDAAVARVTLPMPGGVESVNAAVAGAITMWERRRLTPRESPATG